MINRVVLVGRLTKDPDLRYTPSGAAVARFTLAVNRTFSNAQGEKETDFINCTVWRKQAENTANFLKKGSLAGVEGRIQTGSYEGQDGKRVYTTEVVADSVQFLEPKSSGAGADRSQGQQPSYQQNQSPSPSQQNPSQQNYTRVDQDPFSSGSGPIEVSDDDLPF
ncbi:single-strand DNA-binding protein [Planomicrobium koreense]|jgi:single-strand DNA-binding protein|uniref:Single-stranded DNA-binding protein n=1 Tax=Planococcus koreensis TaxID=112331 RepID=A0A7W8CTB8_9BACL|nr:MULTISPECIES: single-stranded DNA-binding protein [Planococcus]MBB5180509.1 single-strand DNA-binding protein [Planococcus koreensis]MDN3451111.1 single-stranded DNA-binding protein [Planococcus sp. APC 3906]